MPAHKLARDVLVFGGTTADTASSLVGLQENARAVGSGAGVGCWGPEGENNRAAWPMHRRLLRKFTAVYRPIGLLLVVEPNTIIHRPAGAISSKRKIAHPVIPTASERPAVTWLAH
jgi:hypothetical protein